MPRDVDVTRYASESARPVMRSDDDGAIRRVDDSTSRCVIRAAMSQQRVFDAFYSMYAICNTPRDAHVTRVMMPRHGYRHEFTRECRLRRVHAR